MEKTNLPLVTKFSYGVGHVFNDLCASMWFTYLLVFYENVLQFDPTVAGLILLVGQVADGISTPIVGIFCDKENKIPLCARYGRRKVWHLLGTVLIFFSFPFIFNSCIGCENADQWSQFGYYVMFVIVFQFGWACVQISHLALIPDLTSKKSQRTELNSIRYAFTVLANLTVFTIMFFVLNSDVDHNNNNNNDNGDGGGYFNNSCGNDTVTGSTLGCFPVSTEEPNNVEQIGPEDAKNFRNIAIICVVVGAVFSIIFHIGVREPEFVSHKKRCEMQLPSDEKVPPRNPKRMKMIDWFKEVPFYQIAILYMATRLYVNLYQAYIPLYVQETLQLDQTFLATVPFAMYLAGFTGSLVMKEINKKIGRKGTFALGCCFGLAGCTWVWFGKGDYYTQWGIFVVGALLGIGGSTLLITSLSITADLIGENVEGGAFVYGFMSLVDKFSNGIIIMVIQESNPGESWYYRSVITFACGSACLLGLVTVISLINTKVGRSRTRTRVLSILENSDVSDQESESSKCGIDNPISIICTEATIPPSSSSPISTSSSKSSDSSTTGTSLSSYSERL